MKRCRVLSSFILTRFLLRSENIVGRVFLFLLLCVAESLFNHFCLVLFFFFLFRIIILCHGVTTCTRRVHRKLSIMDYIGNLGDGDGLSSLYNVNNVNMG